MHSYETKIAPTIAVKTLEERFKENAEYRQWVEEAQQRYSFRTKHVVTFGEIRKVYKKALSVALFLPEGKDPQDTQWKLKYYDQFLPRIEEWNKDEQWKGWCMIIYISPNCKSFIEDFQKLKIFHRVEFRIMDENPKELAPGTLWRFLTVTDPRFEIVRVGDIDEKLNHLHFYDEFLEDAEIHLGFKAVPSVLINKDHQAINFTGILACRFYTKKEGFVGFNLARAFHLYAGWRLYRIEQGKGRTDEDWEELHNYNLPIGRHEWGWGNHPDRYCFDERFLRVIFLNHAIRKKSAAIYYAKTQEIHEDQQLFNQWIQARKNKVIIC